MIDVTQLDAIAAARPVDAHGGGSGGSGSHGGARQRERPRPERPSSFVDSSAILAVPPAEMTEAVRRALDTVIAEIDALRRALDLSHEHLDYLEDLADADPVVPAVNRRAFLRILGQALGRAERTGTSDAVMAIHVSNAEAAWHRAGPAAVEALLAAAVDVLGRHVRASDVVAGMGGHDLAVLLAATTPEAARDKMRELAAALAGARVEAGGAFLALEIDCGLHAAVPGETAATVVTAAFRAARGTAGDRSEAGGRRFRQ